MWNGVRARLMNMPERFLLGVERSVAGAVDDALMPVVDGGYGGGAVQDALRRKSGMSRPSSGGSGCSACCSTDCAAHSWPLRDTSSTSVAEKPYLCLSNSKNRRLSAG